MTGIPHALDPATAEEYLAGREIMAAAGLLADPVSFAYYGLEEPPKDEVLSGVPADRRLRAFLINLKNGESTDVVVSFGRRSVVSARTVDTAAEGQLPIVDSEYHLVEEITRADPGWQEAMARRGLTDMSKIRICPITAGAFRAPPEDDERRMVRVLGFLQAREHDLAWAHPIDGVTAHVDLIEKKVLRVIDEFSLPVPAESGDYDDPAVRGPERTTLRPIEITQPEGPSFTVDGNLLRWQDWSLRVGFDAREGLTLHQIELAGRPVIYRASVPEMVVPYGFNGSAQSRRQRRLVVSYFTTVGNYDYGFYWYFYLDGTIECEVKMTGIVFTAGHPGGDHPNSTEVAPGLGAPVHQHLFSARLDMSVDGTANAVEEVDVTGLPIGPDNPYGNAIVQRVTRLTSESAGARSGDSSRGRVWRVLSGSAVNRFGKPTAFTLYPEPQPALLADPSSPVAARAGFATRALWVTRYDPAQRYPAGDFVNQSPGGGGLPAYIAADRDIDGQDIVVWHTFGPTHFVRLEDWPVMPVTRTGFMLKPTGFFDRNPALDVPAPASHCHPGS
jgi:Cu2+-containing amine oxidase